MNIKITVIALIMILENNLVCLLSSSNRTKQFDYNICNKINYNETYNWTNKYYDKSLKAVDKLVKNDDIISEHYKFIGKQKVIYYGKITENQAEQIVEKFIGKYYSNITYKYDHSDNRNNVNYYVIHVYKSMGNYVTTIGWYYVDKNTGEVYKWDIINDKLLQLK